MNKFIPLSVPNLKGNEIEYVTKVLEEEWVSTGGSMIEKFEKDISTYVKSSGAVACQSGTAGLHLALISLHIGAGEEVFVPTLTFIAAVNPVKYVSAEPIFMDCDNSLCLDPVKLQKFIDNECSFDGISLRNKKTNKLIRAIIVVHVFGNLANMVEIMRIAKMYNLYVIEDSTEALGSYYTEGIYKGKFAGTIGDIGVYSFNGNKIMTTGGGGMVVSNNLDLLQKIKYLSTQAKDDVVNFIHGDIGFNYRMTNVQAAIGIAQLEKLNQFIKTKIDNYLRYKQNLSDIKGIKMLEFRSGTRSNHWFYSLLLKQSELNVQTLIDKLNAQGIQTRPIWGLIHQQIPYKDTQIYEIENAIWYRQRILNLPCSTNLSQSDVDYVSCVLKKFVGD